MSSTPQAARSRTFPSRQTALMALRVAAVIALIALIWSTVQLEPWRQAAGSPGNAAASGEIPWTQVNPIGVNTFLGHEVEAWKRERTVEMAAEAGAGWIKQHFPWRDIETEQDVYWDNRFQQDAWAKYDHIVELAERNGLRVIARIDLAPDWARPFGSSATAPPENYADYADFIAEFVRHYQGRVQFIQVWNEPNLAAEWGGAIDPEGYARLLRAAAEAAWSIDPNVVILSAPMAMTTENSERAMDDLSYWQALYDAGVAPYFDIMSANAYGLDQPYDAAPDPGALNIRRIELLRELAIANGDGGKPIWLNEYGWNASPPDFPADQLIWSRVDEARQAEWTRAGIEFMRERHAWFGVANTWYFRQVGDIPKSRSDFYFRMVDVAFTPRPLYWSVKALGDELRVAGDGVHNDLAAPIRPLGQWPVVRAPEASGGEYIAGRPGARLLIEIDGNAASLQLAPGQPATAVKLRLSDNGGTKTIDVEAGEDRLKLFNGSASSAPRRVTVEVEVTGEEPLLVDGLVVEGRRDYRLAAASAAALIASAGLYVLLRRGAAR